MEPMNEQNQNRMYVVRRDGTPGRQLPVGSKEDPWQAIDLGHSVHYVPLLEVKRHNGNAECDCLCKPEQDYGSRHKVPVWIHQHILH